MSIATPIFRTTCWRNSELRCQQLGVAIRPGPGRQRAGDAPGRQREDRWRKWERRIRLDRNDHLWRPTAQWVADRYEDQGTVERVVLIRIFSDTPEPGSGDERVWETIEFYDYDLTTGEQRS